MDDELRERDGPADDGGPCRDGEQGTLMEADERPPLVYDAVLDRWVPKPRRSTRRMTPASGMGQQPL